MLKHGGPIASMHDVNQKHFPWAAWQEGRWWLLGVGGVVPCLSSKLGEMPSKLAFEWSCASKIRSAHESINDECVDGTESQPGHNTHKSDGIPNFGIKPIDSRI